MSRLDAPAPAAVGGEGQARQRRQDSALAWVLLSVVLIVFFGVIMPDHGNDLKLYHESADALAAGRLPYRDFKLEYPPFALAAFVLPRLISWGQAQTREAYGMWFLLQNVVMSCLIALTLLAVRKRWEGRDRPDPVSTVRRYAVYSCGMMFLLPWRYDIFPTLLTALALFAFTARRPALTGVFCGLAIAAKLYPVVLLPFLALYWVVKGERRSLLLFAAGTVGALAAALIPLLVVGPENALSFVRYHQMRGLQIESGAAGLVIIAHVLGIASAYPNFDYGAIHIASPLANVLLPLLPLLFLALWVKAILLCAKQYREEYASAGAISTGSVVRFCAVGLIAFLVTNKVFSPQFMMWLMPFLALAPPRYHRLGIAAYVLTFLIFPFFYGDIMAMRGFGALLLNARNVLLILLGLQLGGSVPVPKRGVEAHAP